MTKQRDTKADAPAPTACGCEHPLPQQRAEYKGSARTICVRCGLPVPIRFGR